MNTEQLHSRHLEAISSRVFADAYTSIANEPSATITGEKEAASACTLITIEEMKGFAQFSTGYHSFGDGTWRNKSGGITLTFDELINLYLTNKQ